MRFDSDHGGLDADKVGPWLRRHRGVEVVCRVSWRRRRTAALAVTPASSAPRRKYRGPGSLPLLALDLAVRSILVPRRSPLEAGRGKGYVTRRYEPGSPHRSSPPCLSVSDRTRFLLRTPPLRRRRSTLMPTGPETHTACYGAELVRTTSPARHQPAPTTLASSLLDMGLTLTWTYASLQDSEGMVSSVGSQQCTVHIQFVTFDFTCSYSEKRVRGVRASSIIISPTRSNCN